MRRRSRRSRRRRSRSSDALLDDERRRRGDNCDRPRQRPCADRPCRAERSEERRLRCHAVEVAAEHAQHPRRAALAIAGAGREHADDWDRGDEAAKLRRAAPRQLGHDERHRTGARHRDERRVARAGAALAVVRRNARRRCAADDDRDEREQRRRDRQRRELPRRGRQRHGREPGDGRRPAGVNDERGAREARAEQDREAGAPERAEHRVRRVAAAALERKPEEGRQRADRHCSGEPGGARAGAAQGREQNADGGGGQCGMGEARDRHGGGRRSRKRVGARSTSSPDRRGGSGCTVGAPASGVLKAL